MMHQVRKAEAKAGHRVLVTFENDEECLIDLSDFVATGEVTRRLRDEAYFALALDVLEDGDGIVWGPDEVEIDADALWYKAHPRDWELDYQSDPSVVSR